MFLRTYLEERLTQNSPSFLGAACLGIEITWFNLRLITRLF